MNSSNMYGRVDRGNFGHGGVIFPILDNWVLSPYKNIFPLF